MQDITIYLLYIIYSIISRQSCISIYIIALDLHAKCKWKPINCTLAQGGIFLAGTAQLGTSCCNFMAAAMQVESSKWAAPKSQSPLGIIKDTRCRKPNVMEQNQTETNRMEQNGSGKALVTRRANLGRQKFEKLSTYLK